MMKYSLLKIIGGFWDSTRYSDKYLFFVDKNYVANCLIKNTLESLWKYENVYNGFINNDLLVVELKDSKILVYSIIENQILRIIEGKLNSSVGQFNSDCYYGNCEQIDENHYLIVKYDLKSNQVLKEQISEHIVVLLLDNFHYLSLNHNDSNEWNYNVISKIDFHTNSVIWQYAISDLGPYLDDTDLMEPPKWSERNIHNLYFEDGYIFVTISKGIIALVAETGELLWHTDLSFNPLYLSFDQGKIYCRDWERFASFELTTEKILLQKEYVGFEINGEEIWNIQSYGLVIKDNKGYFMLDHAKTSYLLSINLEDGCVIIETELPEIKNHVHTEKIRFEGNRLYINDCASFLYVYELVEG